MSATAAAQAGSALLMGAKITGRSLRQEEFVELRVASGMWFRISSIEGKKLTRRARQFSSLSWAQAFSSRWLAQALLRAIARGCSASELVADPPMLADDPDHRSIAQSERTD
jgi:hypothetical protein